MNTHQLAVERKTEELVIESVLKILNKDDWDPECQNVWESGERVHDIVKSVFSGKTTPPTCKGADLLRVI